VEQDEKMKKEEAIKIQFYKKIYDISESDQSHASAEKDKTKDWQKAKYVDERTSLLSG
jgi:hypothetical protein